MNTSDRDGDVAGRERAPGYPARCALGWHRVCQDKMYSKTGKKKIVIHNDETSCRFQVGSGEIFIDDAEWAELVEEAGGDAAAARQLAVRRRSSQRSANYVRHKCSVHFFLLNMY